MPELPLKGKTALVSGASRGIGAAVARSLARRGAKVLLVARSEPDLQRLAMAIGEEGGEAYPFACDLSDGESVEALGVVISAEFGDLDILVNNAGAGRWLSVEETPPGGAEEMMALPYFAAFNLTKAFLAGLKRKRGTILQVNSPASIVPWPGATGYAAARWALRGFDLALKGELRHSGVQVCHCVFGKVNSEYFKANPGANERLPGMNRWISDSSPEQVGEWIAKAILRRKRRLYRPWPLPLFAFFHRLFPGVVQGMMNRSGWNPRE